MLADRLAAHVGRRLGPVARSASALAMHPSVGGGLTPVGASYDGDRPRHAPTRSDPAPRRGGGRPRRRRVWIAQGLGAPIGGGFMVGNMFWAYAGAALVALAIVLRGVAATAAALTDRDVQEGLARVRPRLEDDDRGVRSSGGDERLVARGTAPRGARAPRPRRPRAPTWRVWPFSSIVASGWPGGSPTTPGRPPSSRSSRQSRCSGRPRGSRGLRSAPCPTCGRL